MTWVLDSTRIKQTFLRPTSDNGASAPRWHTGFRRFCVTAVWGFLFLSCFVAEAAYTPAPKASVKALKITKGKSFNSGVVFVDGRYIPSPYVVERYGNVIRINGIQVTQPIVDWADFLKTQPHAEVVETVVQPEVAEPVAEAPAPSAPAPEPVVAPVSEPVEAPAPAAPKALASDTGEDDPDDPLADLFEEAPAKPVQQATVAETPPPPPPPPPKPAEPVVTKTIRIDGGFVMNDLAQEKVDKINALRTDIDAALRRGGFICFGSTYSRVSGDKRLSFGILEKLPKIMQENTDPRKFAEAVRNAGFVYFPSRLVNDLFANRQSYLLLQKRWKKVKDQSEIDAMLESSSATRF